MQALRLNEVLMRVVAWHNRHPLARRINATQVHSIGEVVLPFASGLPAALPAPAFTPPTLPSAAELLDPAATAPMSEPIEPAEPAEPSPAPPLADIGLADVSLPDDPPVEATPQMPDAAPAFAETLPQEPPADADEVAADNTLPGAASETAPAEVEVDFSQDPFELAEADLAAEAQAEQAAAEAATEADADALQAHAAELAASDAHSAAEPPHPIEPTETTEPPAPAVPNTAAATAAPNPAPGLATAAPATGWQQRLSRWFTRRQSGAAALPALQATFSRDFIWPLRPRQVARWARRHAALAPLAPADWPRRVVETDAMLQTAARSQGLPHALPLHLLTAAIGVGDRRIRVLMDGHGNIIGPRAYSRSRVACATGVLVLGLGAGSWGMLRPGGAELAQDAAVVVATAADHASDAASAAAAQAAPSASDAEPPAAPADHAAEASTQTAQATPGTPGPAQAMPSDTTATAALGQIRPVLSERAKQAARQQGTALRGSAAAQARAAAMKPPEPVFAVVTYPNPERDIAAQGLALMRATSVRLPGPLPERNELLLSQGEWRAAWWPFTSQADAERARVMLAGRGLKAEVVEF